MHRPRTGCFGSHQSRVGVIASLFTSSLALVACASTPAAVGPGSTSVAAARSSAPVATATPSATPAATSAAEADSRPTSWRMPNLVGHGLQDAQDTIQALTDDRIFVTKSHDATGAGRHQILDRDWKVCDQDVRPGATITVGTTIDFGAVKLSERCPRS